MECKVSISPDLAMPILLGPYMATHAFAPLGPTPPPSPTSIMLEPSVQMYWPPGALMGTTKLTEDKVKHGGFDIVCESHDCGPLIPHIPGYPLNNALAPLHTVMSKRQAKFAAGEIKANKTPIAHCLLNNLPPTPMTTCGQPVSPPSSDAGTSLQNSLILGVHIIDLLAGWATIAVEMIVDWITNRKEPDEVGSEWEPIRQEWDNWLWGLRGRQPPQNGGEPQRAQTQVGGGSSIVGGLIRLAGQLTGVYHGDARGELTVGSGPYGVKFEVSRDGVTGDITLQATEEATLPLGLGGVAMNEQLTIPGQTGEVTGRVGLTGRLGGAEREGHYDTREGFDSSGHWPDL